VDCAAAAPASGKQGDEDLVSTPEISRTYFDSLTAPRKEFLRMARTGHDPNRTMLDLQFEVLRSQLRAEALASDRP